MSTGANECEPYHAPTSGQHTHANSHMPICAYSHAQAHSRLIGDCIFKQTASYFRPLPTSYPDGKEHRIIRLEKELRDAKKALLKTDEENERNKIR